MASKKEYDSFTFNARGRLTSFAKIAVTFRDTYGMYLRSRSEVISVALDVLASLFEKERKLPFPIPSVKDAEEVVKGMGWKMSKASLVQDISLRGNDPIPTREAIEEMLERASAILTKQTGDSSEAHFSEPKGSMFESKKEEKK